MRLAWGIAGAVGVAVSAVVALATPASAARAIPADELARTVGVNIHLMFHNTPYKDLDETRRALRWLGVRYVRDGVSAPAPPRGAWYRREQARRFTALGHDGVRITLIAGGPDRSGDTLAARLAAVRALPGVIALEGPNEWDLNGGGDWAATLPGLQRRLFAAVSADPVLRGRGVRVYGPSFGRIENVGAVGDLSDAMDVGNLHAYSGGRQPEVAEVPEGQGLPELLALARTVNGPQPIVLTEAGFHNADRQWGRMPPVPEDVAAVYTLRTFLEHARVGIRRTYLYELFDSFDDPLKINAEANFGLFTHDREPKPAAVALRKLLRRTRDGGRSPARASLAVKLSGGGDQVRSLLMAKSHGRFSLAIWRAVPVWDPGRRREVAVAEEPITVGLPRRFASVRVRRPAELDDPAEVWSDRRRVEVPVGGAPVIVELGPGRARTAAAGAPVPPVTLPFL